jgi:hypothetical protein
MSELDTTSPDAGDDTVSAIVADETGVDQALEEEQPELDDDGNPITPEVVEPEDEEVEFEDTKLKVPKDKAQAIKDALLRQADYTRKTQELADQRKALDAERASVQQASQGEIDALANVRALDHQIAEYQKVDWDAHFEQNPLDAPRDFARYQGLMQSRQQAAGQYTHLKGQREAQTQQETVKRIEAGRAVLQRDIKDWSPALAETLLQTGVKQYGFERGEIESFEDPRMVKVLHDAHQYQLLRAAQEKVATATKGQEVPLATTLKGASGRTPVNPATRDFAAFEKLAAKASP